MINGSTVSSFGVFEVGSLLIMDIDRPDLLHLVVAPIKIIAFHNRKLSSETGVMASWVKEIKTSIAIVTVVMRILVVCRYYYSVS